MSGVDLRSFTKEEWEEFQRTHNRHNAFEGDDAYPYLIYEKTVLDLLEDPHFVAAYKDPENGWIYLAFEDGSGYRIFPSTPS